MFKNFLKLSTVAVLMLVSVFFTVVPVLADFYGIDDAQKATCDSGGKNCLLPTQVAKSADIPSLIGNLVAALLSLLGVIFFLLMIYAGVLWMGARGDQAKVDKAKEILESAIIGLLIVLSAYAISNFVFTELVGKVAG